MRTDPVVGCAGYLHHPQILVITVALPRYRFRFRLPVFLQAGISRVRDSVERAGGADSRACNQPQPLCMTGCFKVAAGVAGQLGECHGVDATPPLFFHIFPDVRVGGQHRQ